jgi:hypothetical protein
MCAVIGRPCSQGELTAVARDSPQNLSGRSTRDASRLRPCSASAPGRISGERAGDDSSPHGRAPARRGLGVRHEESKPTATDATQPMTTGDDGDRVDFDAEGPPVPAFVPGALNLVVTEALRAEAADGPWGRPLGT